MSKCITHQMKLSDDEFKKVKQEKQTIIIRLNDDDTKDINAKDKIIFANSSNKKMTKKVKRIHTYETFEELINNEKKKQLGFKKKDEINPDSLGYKKTDIKKHGIKGIELKKKKHILKKLFFIILFIVFIVVVGTKINSIFTEHNIKKISNTVSEYKETKTSYVFIEINPSLVITMKNNKVSDTACLNDDCMKIYNDINILGKSINESIEIIYDVAKEKGYDTSKGVKLKSTETIDIEKKDYITAEYINPTQEKELLKNVINNNEIKTNNNNTYYNELWDKLKKDSDYDKIYTCSMNNERLECYFIPEAITPLDDVLNERVPITDILQKNVFTVLSNVTNTLEKFDIKVSRNTMGTTFYINNIEYNYTLSTDCFRKYTTQECIEDFGCFPEYHMSKFNIKDLDLLNQNSIIEKIEEI